jgi:hypothetical protein
MRPSSRGAGIPIAKDHRHSHFIEAAPAALCIHLCIGMAYGWYLAAAVARCRPERERCPDMTLVQELFTTTCDWRIASRAGFHVVLRIARAFRPRSGAAGPKARPAQSRRRCRCAGLADLWLALSKVYIHQLWLMAAPASSAVSTRA